MTPWIRIQLSMLVSPSENESGLYSIYADNCIFQNFKTKKMKYFQGIYWHKRICLVFPIRVLKTVCQAKSMHDNIILANTTKCYYAKNNVFKNIIDSNY